MQPEYRQKPLHVFPLFAREDRAFRDTLDKHLSALKRKGAIEDWHEHDIAPGSEWQEVLDEQLEQADIILLFVTPDFMASEYCYSIQKRALEKHDSGSARVIPILFRPTFWYDTPLAQLQGLPISEKEGIKPVKEWKNKDEPYVRIVMGIMRTIEDLTEPPTSQSPSSPALSLWNVPYLRNRFFTGRDKLLLALHRALTQDRDTAISSQAISGPGGIGKTQIALEYAYHYRSEYQAVFWLNGDTQEDLLTDYVHLASLLNLPEEKESNQRVVIAAVRRYLSRVPGWLLIIDNLENVELLDDLVPSTGKGVLLITTRGQATGIAVTLSEVEKMTPDEGALFLLRRAKIVAHDAALEAVPATFMSQAHEIYELADGLPLALDQAGAYIEETKISLPEYSKLYEKRAAALLKQRGKFTGGHPASVATTFALCIAQAQQRNSASVDLLSLCAFLHPDAIPVAVFSAATPDFEPTLQSVVADELELNAALKTLLDLSLLQRNREAGTISVHRLIQVVLKDRMDEATRRLWAERAVKALSRLFPVPEYEVWQKCQQYLPHALLAADLIEEESFLFPEAARLLYLTACYLYTRASYADARRLGERALHLDEQVHGNEHSETARTLERLGEIYETLGDYTRAQQHYERAMTIAERVWGAKHPDTAHLLNNLGELFQTLDQLDHAENYYRRALAIREKVLTLEHPDTASSLNNVAGICEEQGHHAQAQPLYEQALQLRKRLCGPNHPDTAESLSNVARFYRVIGKYAQARPLYEQAITSNEQAFGLEHPRVATCLNNFAVFCTTLGHYAQAEQLLTRALSIRTQLFGLQHLSTSGSWNNLARVYMKQGRYEEARMLYEQALRVVDEHKLSRSHSSAISILTNLGELYLLQGDYDRAEPLLVEVHTTITERQSTNAATVLNLLGTIYLAQARYERAETLLTEALTIRQEALGKTHPETAMSLKSLGDLAFARNDDVQAEQFYRQALDILRASLGADSPAVVELIARYTEVLRRLGRDGEQA